MEAWAKPLRGPAAASAVLPSWREIARTLTVQSLSTGLSPLDFRHQDVRRPGQRLGHPGRDGGTTGVDYSRQEETVYGKLPLR